MTITLKTLIEWRDKVKAAELKMRPSIGVVDEWHGLIQVASDLTAKINRLSAEIEIPVEADGE